MRQHSTLLALAALAGCNSPDTAAETDSGGINGGTTAMLSSGAGADASTTSGAAATGDIPTTGITTTADITATSGAPPTTGSLTTGAPGTTGADDTTTGETTGADESTTTGPPEPPPWAPKGCPAIFDQALLPTFEIEISDAELSKLESEWKKADDNNTPEHPLKSFKYEDTVVTTATARLRGNGKWWFEQGKMQLQISFNTYDKKGRFMGLRKLLFDCARYNESFLRDRLAMTILQDVGVPSPCSNNARLVLNGEYYGLFTSIEKADKEFLERTFEDPEGNLYKRAKWEKTTNESDPNVADIEVLLAAETIDELDAAMHLEEAILEWAAEAVMPNGDGAWAGGLNYYVYNDPKTGFNVIPWDLDATFTRLDHDVDPYTYLKPGDHGRDFYKIATSDPVWFKKYIEAIALVLDKAYDVDVLQHRIDTWGAQIAVAAAEDPNKPFSTMDHLEAVQEKREFVAKRAAFIKDWLKCWQNGGTKSNSGKCTP